MAKVVGGRRRCRSASRRRSASGEARGGDDGGITSSPRRSLLPATVKPYTNARPQLAPPPPNPIRRLLHLPQSRLLSISISQIPTSSLSSCGATGRPRWRVGGALQDAPAPSGRLRQWSASSSPSAASSCRSEGQGGGRRRIGIEEEDGGIGEDASRFGTSTPLPGAPSPVHAAALVFPLPSNAGDQEPEEKEAVRDLWPLPGSAISHPPHESAVPLPPHGKMSSASPPAIVAILCISNSSPATRDWFGYWISCMLGSTRREKKGDKQIGQALDIVSASAEAILVYYPCVGLTNLLRGHIDLIVFKILAVLLRGYTDSVGLVLVDMVQGHLDVLELADHLSIILQILCLSSKAVGLQIPIRPMLSFPEMAQLEFGMD